MDYVVGGAVARDLLLFHVFGEPTTRATRDVDLMVGVEHWAAFEAFKTRLVATGAFVGVPGLPHRLLYAAAEIPLDLVPFGGIEDPAGTVAWPPERRVLMSVVGFREATAAAVAVEVAHELTVPVVTLAALSLLKVSAWLDRRHVTDKDAVDLLLLLRGYAAAGNLDRLYEEEADLLRASGFDPELAGARLLGQDAVRICGADVARTILDRMTDAHRLDLEGQLLRQAVLLADVGYQARTRELLAGYWSEIATAAAVA